jgi:hypothetical protein
MEVTGSHTGGNANPGARVEQFGDGEICSARCFTFFLDKKDFLSDTHKVWYVTILFREPHGSSIIQISSPLRFPEQHNKLAYQATHLTSELVQTHGYNLLYALFHRVSQNISQIYVEKKNVLPNLVYMLSPVTARLDRVIIYPFPTLPGKRSDESSDSRTQSRRSLRPENKDHILFCIKSTQQPM